MSTLIARDLAKRYRSRRVVDGVSLRLSGGEVVGLLGPNGAGKTTCFYMMIGLIRCDGGTILLDDQDITAFPMHVRARLGIGYLPQESSVFRKLSVADNVMAILESLPGLTRGQRQQRRDELLEELHISHLKNNLGMSLSGGNVRETLGICERAYIVSDGKVIAEGVPRQLLSNEQVRAVYLGEHFTL
ncbi:MAG: ATP-binding cassette domain-containing protein [Gammaproteobacteria bacterium]